MRKFIKAFEAGAAFDPDTVHILIGAFDDAWASLLNSGAPFAAENHSETARDILAKHIIEAAKKGERDQHKLSEDALLQLARPNLKKASPRRAAITQNEMLPTTNSSLLRVKYWRSETRRREPAR